MKQIIKNSITKDYEAKLPKGFDQKLKDMVLSNLPSMRMPWYRKLDREDLYLAIAIVVCTGLVYFIGFSPEWKVRVDIRNSSVYNLGYTLSGILVLSYLAISEYYERKKYLLL